MTSNAARALDPLEFRFTDPEDVQRYGDRWYVYDESHYLRLRARDLIELETAMDLRMVLVMNELRASSTIGDTAAAWLGVRQVDAGLAGKFDDFNPVTNMIEWRPAEGKAPAAETAMPEPLALWDQPPTTSETPDLVVLPTMPVAE
jgi:hypothetical protein